MDSKTYVQTHEAEHLDDAAQFTSRTSNSSSKMSELMITPTEELGLWEKLRNTRGAVDDDVRTRQTMLQRSLRHCYPTFGTG